MKSILMGCALLLSTLAAGEKPERSLDALAEQYLVLPQVLTDIGLSKSQTALLLVRPHMSAVRDAVKQISGALEEGDSQATITWNWSGPRDLLVLGLRDLNERQRTRLRQIAMQADPVAALCSNDVALALQLDLRQRSRLEAIAGAKPDKAKVDALRKRMMAKMAALKAAMSKLSAGNGDNAGNTKAKESQTAVFLDRFERLVVDEPASLLPPVKSNTRDAKKALGLLSIKQRHRFIQLQGRRLQFAP